MMGEAIFCEDCGKHLGFIVDWGIISLGKKRVICNACYPMWKAAQAKKRAEQEKFRRAQKLRKRGTYY